MQVGWEVDSAIATLDKKTCDVAATLSASLPKQSSLLLDLYYAGAINLLNLNLSLDLGLDLDLDLDLGLDLDLDLDLHLDLHLNLHLRSHLHSHSHLHLHLDLHT